MRPVAEYITTLEEEISSRDTIIDQLRDEVGVVRSENKTLHLEVDSLKSCAFPSRYNCNRLAHKLEITVNGKSLWPRWRR